MLDFSYTFPLTVTCFTSFFPPRSGLLRGITFSNGRMSRLLPGQVEAAVPSRAAESELPPLRRAHLQPRRR